MIYSILEQEVYLNSRYEFIQLMEDICPTRNGKFETIEAFNKVASVYEQLINESFPVIPLSEERLAIFSLVYSEEGFVSEGLIRAIEWGDRLGVLAALKIPDPGNDLLEINLQKRRFYEAQIFNE